MNHKMSSKTLANDKKLGGSNIVSEEEENTTTLVQKLTQMLIEGYLPLFLGQYFAT